MQSNEHPHDIPLADSEPVGWGWRGFLLALWVGGSFGGMYFVRQLEQITVLGWPLGYWLAAQGLKRGENGLRLIMMCEVPSNAILAEQFLEYFDGFSIGSNDLTQLTLGLDRDSGLELLAADFDERDPAVKALLSRAIAACKAQGKYVGICGQGPSDHPDFAQWLAQEGIVSISLNPDTVIDTWKGLAKA